MVNSFPFSCVQSFDKERDIEGYNIRPPEKVFSISHYQYEGNKMYIVSFMETLKLNDKSACANQVCLCYLVPVIFLRRL